jgi:hypothetical protein
MLVFEVPSLLTRRIARCLLKFRWRFSSKFWILDFYHVPLADSFSH